jgi:pyridoxine 5-phosphate synthase
VTLVPERREEITTEGGLDLSGPAGERVTAAVDRLRSAGVRTSLFVDPRPETIRAAEGIGPTAVELHTGEFANAVGGEARRAEVDRLRAGVELARELGMAAHAGHGLTYENVTSVAAIEGCEELNIGHSIVSRAVFTGMERAVREMKEIVLRARSG